MVWYGHQSVPRGDCKRFGELLWSSPAIAIAPPQLLGQLCKHSDWEYSTDQHHLLIWISFSPLFAAARILPFWSGQWNPAGAQQRNFQSSNDVFWLWSIHILETFPSKPRQGPHLSIRIGIWSRSNASGVEVPRKIERHWNGNGGEEQESEGALHSSLSIKDHYWYRKMSPNIGPEHNKKSKYIHTVEQSLKSLFWCTHTRIIFAKDYILLKHF